MNLKTIIILTSMFIIHSCGRNNSSKVTPQAGLWRSFEKNNLLCSECMLFEESGRFINITFNNTLSYHDCGLGTYTFRNILNESVIIPNNNEGRNQYNIELISNVTNTPSCLKENMILSLEKENDILTIQLDTDVYLTKEN